MAAPAFVRRELKTAKAYFVPLGESVDSVTVSKTTWPDGDPVTNYTNFEVPEIEGLVEELMTEEEVFLLPRDSGGYQNETETHLRGIKWTATTSKTNSYVKQLQLATPGVPVATTAQAPSELGKVQKDGILLIELRNAGVVIERIQVWARMTLADVGAAAASTTSKIQIRWELLVAGNNTSVVLA
jgi:hypothetical protein